MKVEEFVIEKLSAALSVPVSGDVPSSGTVESFVTVEQTGSASSDFVYAATIAVQSWAGTRDEACNLNEQVKTAMEAVAALDTVSRCLLTNDYHFPDLTTKRPRYQAVFEVILFK